MLTVEEVAKELRVDQKTVRRWIQRGELVAIDIGREYRISGSLWTRVKLNCKARWPARAQAIGAAPATQEVGAVATSRSNSAAA